MKKTLLVLVMAVVLMHGVDVMAQDSDWTVSVTPYAWLAGLEGDTGVGQLQGSVDKSFSDLLDDLEFAAMLSVDANNGTFGIVGDMFFVGLEAGGQTLLGELKSDVDQWILTAIPYYRVQCEHDVTVDLGIGVRYMDTDLKVTGPDVLIEGSQAWASPLLFGRMNVPMGEKAFMNFSADVGGFGVESDFMWQVVGTAGYAVSEKVDLLFSYRHLDVDFSEHLFTYDMKTKGFAIGARIEL